MQITHEQAQQLIQFSLDGVLKSAEKSMLASHLHNCRECQAYANEVKAVDTLLSPMLKRQWNIQPVPLSIKTLIATNQKTQISAFLAIRNAAVTLVVFALFFSVWQFVSPNQPDSDYVPLIVPSVPTPSAQTAQSTSTTITLESCEMMVYTVQGNDTLSSIADRFLVSENEIMEINRLKTVTVNDSMELVIPICNFTPTGTIHPATFTTTYTPIFHPSASTPEG